MTRKTLYVDWQPISAESLAKRSLYRVATPDGDAARSTGERISEMIAVGGVPVVTGATSARDAAITLLQLAAEVEHALMVQYLYAGLSVAEQDGAAIDYREKIVDIAVQEMGHLATVQNLLLLLGGPEAVHLQRDVLRRGSPKNPIPFVLERVSLPCLAKFVAAERPAEIPAEWQSQVAELVASAKQDAGMAVNRVGVIYALLRWMFSSPEDDVAGIDFSAALPQLDQPRLTDQDLRPRTEIEPYVILKEDSEWQASEEDFLLLHAWTRADAVAAIDQVAAQGEGLLHDPASSHFEQFMALVQDFNQGKIQVLALPKSPTLGKDGAERGSTITDPYTRLWGEAFSLQYTLLILSIQHALCMQKAPDQAGLREQVTRSALGRMRRVIMPVGRVLTSIPKDEAGAAPAGPPYDLDPQLLQEHDPAKLPAVHLGILDRLAALYDTIALRPELADEPDHQNTLKNLKNLDASHRKLFKQPSETP